MKIITKILSVLLVMIFVIFELVNIVQAVNQKEIILVIDPGHGGKMTGTANDNLGLVERDVTLKISRYLRDYLNEYEGIKVIMTHDGLPSDYEMELPARGMVARNNNADMMISIHINDSSAQDQHGAEVFVTANKLLPKYNKQSTKFGNLVLNELSKLGIANRGVKTRLCGDTGPKWEYSDGSVADYYAVIRYPMKGDGEDRGADLAKGEGIPGVLIEHCFMKGQDAQFLDSEQDIQNLARADCNAIVSFYGLEKKDPKRVSTITLNKDNIRLIKGKKETLIATVKPDTAINKKVIWTSSNNEVATVSDNGEITALKEGTVTISAKTEDRERIATCEVTVQEIKINFSKNEMNLLVGKKANIDYIITPEDLENKKVTWKSSDETIATVSNEGEVTALKEGTVDITATMEVEDKQATIKINIHKLDEKQKIDLGTLKVEKNRLSKIGEKISATDFKKRIIVSDNLDIILKNENGNLLKDDDYVTTNTQVQIIGKESQQVLQEYICIIYGDVNCDGKITPADYVKIKNHIMEVSTITGVMKKSADIDQNNKITPADYVKVKNHIMKVTTITI